MIAVWMLQAIMVAALLALAARAAEELLRLVRLPLRFAWATSLLLALALPLYLAWTLQHPAPAQPAGLDSAMAAEVAAAADAGASSATVTSWPALARARAWLGDAGARVHGELIALPGAAALERALFALWIALSLGFALLFGATLYRFGRARRRWRAHEIAGTTVYVAPRGGPAVVGLLRPAIVVPRWLLQQPAERQRMVVLHEREHLRGGDHALLAAAAALVALLPWNLPLHWMLRRLRLAVELDCDRRVLAAGTRPLDYGSLLIDMASRQTPTLLATAALIDSSTDLERRIIAMTSRLPRFRAARASVAAAAATALLLVACDMNLAELGLQDATVGDAIAAARAAAIVDDALLTPDTRVVVDGQTTTLRELHDVPLARVERVAVPPRAATSAAALPEIRLRPADIALANTQPTVQLRQIGMDGVTPVQRVATLPVTISRSPETGAYAVEVANDRPGVIVMGVTGERAADAARLPEVALIGALAGEAGSAEVSSASGRPGASARITIRGAAAATGRQPLFVIDGVPMVAGADGNTLNVSPNDIERISVLRGAAGTALYGDRAVNGVIIITTKKP